MTEATWGDGSMDPDLDRRMSATLEAVPGGDSDLAEVTSLEGAACDRLMLNAKHKSYATPASLKI